MQGQNRNQLQSAIRSLQYVPGGRGPADLEGALRQTRVTQFTEDNGARLGIVNVALILTSTTSPLSQQVSHHNRCTAPPSPLRRRYRPVFGRPLQ